MADLNSTIVKGNLRVTDDINTSGSIAAVSYTENGTLLSNKYAPYTHTHSYLPLSGGTLTGVLNFTVNQNALDFRPTHDSYHTYVAYETNGNEALLFKTKQGVTSFIFANGITSDTTDSEWMSISNPGLQIKSNCVSIGKLIGHNVSPTYKLDVNGTANATTLYENGTAISTTYASKTYVDNAIAAAITTALNTAV